MVEWLTRFEQVHPRVAWRDHDPKFGPTFVRGQGSRLWDTAGNDYIDLVCGYSAANFGQAFPPLVAAATRQLQQFTHVTGEPHVGRIELAEQLLALFAFDGQQSQVMFNVTGARGVETAWKAAVAYRPGKVLTVGPCFHGRSIATQRLGGTSQTNSAGNSHFGFEDSVVVVNSAEYPYCAACPWNLKFPNCELKCVSSVLQTIAAEAPSLSAVIVEPAIGARGYIFPPAEFLRRLREVTADKGVLLIADEIQTGLGRCGYWSLAQGQGWQPDLLVLGKSLGGGLVPISAVLGRADVLASLPPGSESETYAASPLATAVALEVLSQLRDGGWIEQGKRLGVALREFACSELKKHSWTGCTVEGIGASCIIEFRNATCADRVQLSRHFADACFQHRVLTHFSGPDLTRIVMLPALTMSTAEFEDACTRLRYVFAMNETFR